MLKRKSSKNSGTGESDNGSVASSKAEVGGADPSSEKRQPRRRSSKKIKAKTILGFLSNTGKRKKSMRKKQSQKSALSPVEETKSPSVPSTVESTTQPPSSLEPDLYDEESVYGVSLDNQSIHNLGTVNATSKQESFRRAESFDSTEDNNKPMEIILLLMDPNSRRFELLQLEFDSAKAVFRDVIMQISFSATEDALREQKYSSVCFPSGTMIEADDEKLSKYCKGGEILIAVPEGMSGASCEKLSKPILNDPNIVRLLGNVNNSPVNGEEEKIDESSNKAENEASESKQVSEVESAETNVLSKDAASTSDKSTPLTTLEEETITPQPTACASCSPCAVASSMKLLVVLIAILLPMAWKYQELVTAPLSPGQVISPGERRSKCGILSILPKSYNDCTASYIEMDRSGTLRVFNHENLETVTLTGGTCDTKKSIKNNESCVPGALVQDNGRLLIGGVSPTMSGDKTLSLSPWPFAQRITNKRGKY